MIPIEGKILPGLDEFMLRLGHLKVLCEIADDVGQSWRRIVREMSDKLTTLVEVEESENTSVSDYLLRKHLCPVSTGDTKPSESMDKFRYPDLALIKTGEDTLLTVNTGTRQRPQIWWQDKCLADDVIRSRVGAITIDARAGSKTGLSHICDWAAFLDLISTVGELSFAAKLLVRLPKQTQLAENPANPYILGPERIFLAYAFLREDFDVFSRFAPRLLNAECPLRKADARSLFAEVIQSLADEADSATHLSSQKRFRILEEARELNKSAKRARKEVGETSTAWHRASSRLETYTDLGLLEKGRTDKSEKYAYSYYPTRNLERAVASLQQAENIEDWIEGSLIESLFDNQSDQMAFDPPKLAIFILRTLTALNLPTPICSISVLSQAIAWQSASQGDPRSLRSVRQAIEDLARTQPDVARLSRGHTGSRAEFVSLEQKQLELMAGNER